MDMMGYQYKRTKDSWEKLVESVRKRLDEIGDDKNEHMTYYETTKGFYNLGANKIKEKLCEDLGIDQSEAAFNIKLHDNLEFGCQMFIYYNEKQGN